MLSCSPDVVFWGAASTDFSNITRGFPISHHRFNQTNYQNASFLIHLLPNLIWDKINVLSVWDLTTFSDFGHVTLPANTSDPDPDPNPNWVYTMFDNCKNLSSNYRVRWSLNVEENWIEIGLEAATKTMNYMAFGWANLNRTQELMLGADVAVAVVTEEGMPFVDDFHITSYSECMLHGKDGGPPIGVCPDVVYEDSANAVTLNDTRLVYGYKSILSNDPILKFMA